MQKHLQKLLLIVAMMVVPWVTQAQSAPLSEYTVTTDVTTFNSIASTGTALSFSTQDDGYATTTLPFAFPYGTTVYNAGTSIVCSANGFIQLGASSPSSGTSATYSSSSYCYINAILQQDGHMGRNTGAGAYTRYDATAGTFTIEYHLLGAFSSPYGAYSYQVVLHTNGTIEIIYDSVNLGGASSRTLATYITNGPNNDRLFLTGSWTSPTQSSSYGTRPISPLPTHGLRYTFSTPNFACPRPTSLTASDVTAYGFSINWTDTSSATSWLVQLSSGDSVIYDTVATSQTFTFAGLNPDSYYTAHVSGLCLNGDTSVYRSVEVHTLCVPIDSLPYTYGFEDLSSTGSGTDVNPCWNRGYWSGSYNPNSYPYASTTNHTGSRSLYFYSYSTTTFSWVCLPRFADSISNLHLTFWAKKSSASYSGHIKVGVMSNPADYTTFQNVTTVFTDYTTNWQMFDVAMHNAPNTGLITIMVEAGSTSYNYIYLDDITVDLIPYCTTPIVDSVVATATSADLYLSDVDNATSLTVTLSHGTWDTTIYAMGSPISLSDLQPRTEYTYELYATCGSDSSLVRRGSFCTFCSPISHDELPYTNGFEDITATGSGTPLAPCWGRGYWNGSYSSMSYPYASTTNHTGSRSLYFYSYNSSSYEYRSWLCLPEFADSINTLQISFWAKKSSSDYSGQIKVGVMTDPTDYTTFETVTTLHTDATTNWNNFDVILSTAPGSGHITFMIEAGGTTYNYIYLDDITVGEVPQCPHVQNLALDSVYVDWAAISWTEMGTASTWVLEYDTVDFTPGTYTAAFNETVYDTAYIINNLDTGRTYYLYLRADCSGDTSTYMSLTFSTLNGVPATVPYLCTFESNGTNGWDFANGTQTNHWMVGTTGGNGALFITNDDINNSYTISATSNVYAYRDFYLTDTGEYVYSFDWKGYGESCCDYLRAALMPASFEPEAGSTSGWTQATGTPISGAVVDLTHNNRLNLSNNWGNVTGTFNLTTPGAYKWVFFWHNDGSVGTTPPAAVDNVQLAHNTCPSPTNVTASYVAADTVTITWSPGGNENHWVVGYGSTQEDVYDTTYTFTGLSASTDYVFIVSAVCDANDTSMAATLAVRTACGNITLPFFENFDNVTGATTTSVSTNNLPQCWNNYNVGTNSSYSGYPIVYNSSSYAHSGTNAMRFYIYYTTGSYADQYAILPPTDSTVYPINSMMLNFWMRANSTSYNSYVIVGVMPDENDASSFIPYQYVYTNNSTVYAFHEVDFSDYTGVHGRIAMKFPQPSSGYNYGYVDDIRIELVPDCPRVTNITASNITNSSADISWTENGEATSWTIEYGVHGFEVGTGTSESVSSLPHTLTGLTANTEYDIYVTPDCSGTPAVANITFRTECDAMTTLPYVFGFEGTNTTSSTSHEFVNCWHRLNNGTQYFGYPYITSTAHTGSRSLYWYTSTTTGTYGDYQIVVLPAVDETLYPINTLMLKFWARSSSTSYYPTFQVGVMTDPNDANTFQQVASIDVGNSTQWAEYTAGLANYNGTGRYVALRALRGGWYAYTDDFTLEEAPTCPQVTDVEAVNIGTTGAMLNWSLQSGFAGLPYEYEIEVIPDNPSETFSTLTSSTTHFLLTGLQPSSSYSVRVRGNCGDGYGAWSTLCEFTTLTLPCYQVDTTIHDSITFAGSMTNTNYYIPLNNFYDYSITEQLIMASEMGGGNRVSGIDFYYSYSSPSTLKTNCTIYMANTTVSSLASSFVPYNASTFTRVYTGSLNCSQGWNHFEFSTPFNYDGSSNIVILVHDNSGDYDGSTYTFRASQVGSGIARYSYQDGDPFSLSDLTSGGSSYDYRTDMRLHVAGCALSDSCGAPLVVVDSIAPDQVDIVWAAGFQESSWRVEYRQGSQAWDVVDTVSTPAYSFTGLTPATTYQFRITALCNDTSRATIISATTPCLPMAVPFFENFETFSTSTADPLPACWYKNTN